VGGAFCASLSGTQYDWTWPAIGPLYPFSRHRISGDVIVPVGQRLTAQYYHSFLFESGRKITALDSNISNGFIVNALANSPVSFIAISADPQADHFMRGAKVTGQMRLRNGGAIRLLAGP
jgi:hypothetical protein